MILPNKSILFEKSALGLSKHILKFSPEPQRIGELYSKTHAKFESIDQFMLTLDFLYIVGKIEIEPNTQELVYVEAD